MAASFFFVFLSTPTIKRKKTKTKQQRQQQQQQQQQQLGQYSAILTTHLAPVYMEVGSLDRWGNMWQATPPNM